MIVPAVIAAAVGVLLVAGRIYHRDRLRGSLRSHTSPPPHVHVLHRDPRPYDWQRDDT